MIIYRPHRGMLADAMMEAREFKTLDEMKDYIIKRDIFSIKKEDIVLSEKTHDDNRINWKDIHYVCIKGYKTFAGTYIDYVKMYGKPQCIGMCSDDYGGK